MAFALVKERQAVEIGVRAGAPQRQLVLRLGRDGVVVQQAQRALVGVRVRIVRAGEKLAVKAQLVGKTRKHLHAHGPARLLESQHRGFEVRQRFFAGVETRHARTRDLVALFLVGRAGGRAHLRAAFPAGVARQRVLGLHVVGQCKEPLAHGEGVFNLSQRHTVVGKLEEAHVHRGAPKLVGDLGAARFEVGEVNHADFACMGFRTHRAHARFFLQFGEFVDSVGHGRLLKVEHFKSNFRPA